MFEIDVEKHSVKTQNKMQKQMYPRMVAEMCSLHMSEILEI